MGVGGILLPPNDYWPRVEALLRKHGILLVLDEVVTAYGRVGGWFAAERFGVQPDIIVSAKGIASGYAPLGAVWSGTRSPPLPPRDSRTLAIDLVAEVQVGVDRDDVERRVVRQRAGDDRGDRVVAAGDERHDALADDPRQYLVGAARVLVTGTELERHVADVDETRTALATECMPKVEVVMR
jgi:hypothetical protein